MTDHPTREIDIPRAETSPVELYRRPLSTTQFAEHFGISRVTVVHWIEAGRIPASKLGGRNWKIPRAALMIVVSE